MDPSRSERIQELFAAAIEHPAGEREAYVDAIDDIRFTLAGRVLDRGGEELLNPFRAARIHLPRKASRPTARQLTVEPRARECPVAFDRCRRCPERRRRLVHRHSAEAATLDDP